MFFGMVGLMPALFACNPNESLCAVQKEDNEPWMTVFVHGIISVKPYLSVPNIFKFIEDDIDDTVYCDTVGLMREDPLFYKAQAMQSLGLLAIDPERIEQGYASGLLAVAFECSLTQIGRGSNYNNHRYYTFGWDGILSQMHRYNEARRLYEALELESARLEKEMGRRPKIRLVGYSHGGNVCLNLAAVRRQEKADSPLAIDELTLIGMPVQNETDFLINDPLFVSIDHIYSRNDRVQKMDCFSLNRFFSRRVFTSRPTFKIPNKLTQIQVRFTRHINVYENNAKIDALARNFNNKKTLSGKASFLRSFAPGHTELWFFGWTTQFYRRTKPTNPFPVAAFTPLLVQAAHDFKRKGFLKPNKPVIIDIRAQEETMIVRNQRSLKHVDLVPFISISDLSKMRIFAAPYRPDGYTHEEYEKHSDDAYAQARVMNHKGREEQNFYRRSLKKRKQKAAREARAAFWQYWLGGEETH